MFHALNKYRGYYNSSSSTPPVAGSVNCQPPYNWKPVYWGQNYLNLVQGGVRGL